MSEADEIEREIKRLGRRHDDLPESAVDERLEIVRQVTALRDRLDELAAPSKRLAELEAKREREEQRLEDLRRRRHDQDTEEYIEDSLKGIREIDREIAELDPTTASIELLGESAIGAATDEARKTRARERELEEQRAAIAAATAAVGRGAESALQGDLERAVRSTSDAPDPMTIDNARASEDVIKRNGCTPRVLAGISIGVVIAVIMVMIGINVLGDDESKCPTAARAGGEVLLAADDCGLDVATTVAATTSGSGSSNVVAPPNPDDLPSGVLLFQGRSGDPIGCIACDGQSRFLSLEERGVGVGNLTMGDFATTWKLDGKVLQFGARITAPNKGRYGVNLWIDGAQYGPGVALEIGEQAAQYQWSPERDGTLRSGHLVAIIVGEAGIVDDDGVPVAQGDYELQWWFTFEPS